VALVTVQLSVLGLYLPPVLRETQMGLQYSPPQTIISLPLQTAVCSHRVSGAPVVLVAVHVSPSQEGGGVGVGLTPAKGA
jgi:hypothetical protein